MRRHQLELPLGSGIDRPMAVISYGHYRRPVLVFPSEAGRAWDFENNGMAAVPGLVDDGRIKLYCVDSVDVDTCPTRGSPSRSGRCATRCIPGGSRTPWSRSSMPVPRPARAPGRPARPARCCPRCTLLECLPKSRSVVSWIGGDTTSVRVGVVAAPARSPAATVLLIKGRGGS